MAISDSKITDAQMDENGVCAASDILTGTPAENKAVFDQLARLIAGSVNASIDELQTVQDNSDAWAVAEAGRVSAEAARVTAEDARIAAETLRAQAEAAREDSMTGSIVQATAQADRAVAAADKAVAIAGGEVVLRQELTDDLAAVTADYTAADAALQGNIDAEAERRQSADAALQTALDAFQTALNALQNSIDNETTARIAADALKAALENPIFTGIPKAPTAAVGTNSTQLATTAFVLAQIAQSLGFKLLYGSVTTNGYGQATITFPTAFSTIPKVFAVVGDLTTSNFNYPKVVNLHTITASTAGLIAYQVAETTLANYGGHAVSWLAIGT